MVKPTFSNAASIPINPLEGAEWIMRPHFNYRNKGYKICHMDITCLTSCWFQIPIKTINISLDLQIQRSVFASHLPLPLDPNTKASPFFPEAKPTQSASSPTEHAGFTWRHLGTLFKQLAWNLLLQVKTVAWRSYISPRWLVNLNCFRKYEVTAQNLKVKNSEVFSQVVSTVRNGFV